MSTDFDCIVSITASGVVCHGLLAGLITMIRYCSGWKSCQEGNTLALLSFYTGLRQHQRSLSPLASRVDNIDQWPATLSSLIRDNTLGLHKLMTHRDTALVVRQILNCLNNCIFKHKIFLYGVDSNLLGCQTASTNRRKCAYRVKHRLNKLSLWFKCGKHVTLTR